jgi:UDP-glucose 4-epimerase
MKVFVAGGAGYIGSVCVEHLLDNDYTVVVFDNLTEGHRKAIDPRAEFVEGDLRDFDNIKAALAEARPDAVMHFAANALVGESMEQPEKYFRNNVAAGINLLEAMLLANTRRIVFSSTCATFGTPERVPIDETLPQNPINPYGESKLIFEKILKWYSQLHGFKCVALRYFNAAGASAKYGEDHRVESHLIPNILKVALGQRQQVDIYGTDYETEDGTCVRDYIHIKDLAQAHRLALGAAESGFYNLGTGGGTSVKQVIACCESITGCKIPVVEKPRRPGDPARLIAASGKARGELGWKPEFQDIEAIVRSAWAWHVANPNGYGD